uniref:Uncharacterized protein n=1 Tax=Pseudomonas graminis TaxID=158627 RepID=A0A7C1WTM6_9PSED
MSYEFRLVFADSLSARNVLELVKSSTAYIGATGECVYLKELSVKSEAAYDARLTLEESNSLWLEVGFRSPSLYELLRTAVGNKQHRCLEDGDQDNEVPLYKAFRLKHPPTVEKG